MKFINEFKEAENIIGHYLCRQKQLAKSKTGKMYMTLKLIDKTGSIDAKIWELTNNIQEFEEGEFIKIDADVSVYQGDKQLRVNKLRRSMPGEYDPKDYAPSTNRNIPEMHAELKGYVESISNDYLRQLLNFIIVEDAVISARLLTHSAAKAMHHSYLGGLLEHILSVTGLCNLIAGHYPSLNRDLLLSAAMLHDIGKIYELSPLPENDYTEAGQLIGHIVIGAELITKYAGQIPDFPEDLQMLLKHCILSHHGEYEFGSPKLPSLIEAVALHAADNLDAKTKAFESAIAESANGKEWLGFNRVFQRYIRKSDFNGN